jgi:hypothetical protein
MKTESEKEEVILEIILAQKYKMKERAAENCDFKTFSLISQDIREMERKLKEIKQ